MGFIGTATLIISDCNSLIVISSKINQKFGVAYWWVNTVLFALGQDFKYNIMPTILGFHHAILL